jgi:formylglycine-generating enzyme required for sulfatase activity
VSATTDALAVQAPTAPSGLTATTQNADQIDLSWSDTSDNEEDLEIQRKEGVGGTYAQVATFSAGTTGYQDTGLDSQTTYYYRVRAANSAGESNWSNEANDTTAQLAAPSGLTATAVRDSEIDLTWTDNSNYESGFDIERDSPVVASVGADTTSYSDTGLNPETLYTYRVRATDAGGASPWTGQSSATTLAAGDPESFSAAGISWTMRFVPAKSLPTGTLDSGSATVSEDFWLAETEVTYELWYAVRDWAENGTGGAAGEGQYSFGNRGWEGDDGESGASPTAADQEPVTEINWRDAMLWTNALTEWYNDEEGASLEPVYYTDSGYTTPIRTVDDSTSIDYPNPGSQDDPYVKSDADGFRLPGMDEWELAARYIEDANADGDIEDGGEHYPGVFASGADTMYDGPAVQDFDGDGDQNETGAVGWYSANSGSKTRDVATKDDNALGLYDMSGNVWEWNFDWVPDNVGTYRVRRGGSWDYGAIYQQLGDVAVLYPYGDFYDVGFRPARNAQ